MLLDSVGREKGNRKRRRTHTHSVIVVKNRVMYESYAGTVSQQWIGGKTWHRMQQAQITTEACTSATA